MCVNLLLHGCLSLVLNFLGLEPFHLGYKLLLLKLGSEGVIKDYFD